MKAAIGDVERFARPQKLVSYLGLNPSVRQSGPGPAYHGRITKQGRGHARGMLVEAAWAAARAPGPLRAFFLRVRARRGQHVAAVATARKLAILIWHLLTRRELSLGASGAACQEAARSRAQGRPQGGARTEGRGPCLQHQEPSRAGAALGRAGRGGLRALCRRLEPAGTKGAHGRRKGGATIKAARQGSTSCPALRHAVTRAPQKVSTDRRKKRLSITSVVCGLLVLVRLWSMSRSIENRECPKPATRDCEQH